MPPKLPWLTNAMFKFKLKYSISQFERENLSDLFFCERISSCECSCGKFRQGKENLARLWSLLKFFLQKFHKNDLKFVKWHIVSLSIRHCLGPFPKCQLDYLMFPFAVINETSRWTEEEMEIAKEGLSLSISVSPLSKRKLLQWCLSYFLKSYLDFMGGATLSF